jgi:LysR family transcriptional regulator, nitrogen assimilation regulatory protein
MDVRQLTAAVTVADVGSVTKAARMLHVVQPAVSRQIRLLEEELGVPLFDRTRTGMVPTPAGELLVQRARRALAELERARHELRPDRSGVQGLVSLGLLESVVDLVAERLVREVAERHPAIEIRLLTAYSGHLEGWLRDGDLDLSLLYNLASSPTLSVVPLVEEELWAVAPPGTGLVAGAPVSCRDVARRRLVLPVHGHGLRVVIEEALHAVADVDEPSGLEALVQVNSMHLQKSLVVSGHGWSILPAAGVAADVRTGKLEGGPLAEPKVTRRVAVGFQRVGRTTPAVEVVAQLLGAVVRDLVGEGTWAGAQPPVGGWL